MGLNFYFDTYTDHLPHIAAPAYHNACMVFPVCTTSHRCALLFDAHSDPLTRFYAVHSESIVRYLHGVQHTFRIRCTVYPGHTISNPHGERVGGVKWHYGF